jgi:hypothetical protein
VLPEPCREGRGGAVTEQFDRFGAFQVDQDRPVTLPPEKGEVIHPQHPRGIAGIGIAPPDLAQERIRAHRKTQAPGGPRPRLAAEDIRNKLQDFRLIVRAPGITARQSRKSLGEDPARAVFLVAEPTAGMQLDPGGKSVPGLVRQRTLVTAMDAPGPLLAIRALDLGAAGRDDHDQGVGVVGREIEPNQGAVREEGSTWHIPGDTHPVLLADTRSSKERESHSSGKVHQSGCDYRVR